MLERFVEGDAVIGVDAEQLPDEVFELVALDLRVALQVYVLLREVRVLRW